jgi:hypothetical protein
VDLLLTSFVVSISITFSSNANSTSLLYICHVLSFVIGIWYTGWGAVFNRPEATCCSSTDCNSWSQDINNWWHHIASCYRYSGQQKVNWHFPQSYGRSHHHHLVSTVSHHPAC